MAHLHRKGGDGDKDIAPAIAPSLRMFTETLGRGARPHRPGPEPPYLSVLRGGGRSGMPEDMSWKTVRLELAKTPGYPNGSAVRAYLLRLPLDDAGRIDLGEFRSNPKHATVRRYWPNEPDRLGQLRRTQAGWILSYGRDGTGGEAVLDTGSQPIVPEAILGITEAGSDALSFRVARCER